MSACCPTIWYKVWNKNTSEYYFFFMLHGQIKAGYRKHPSPIVLIGSSYVGSFSPYVVFGCRVCFHLENCN